jgi:3-methyladenine DNA glycosylase/8-oxoguanine DNA glycosylase
MQHFVYGETEIDHLQRRDKRLGREIERLGMIKRQVIPDPFEALIRSIISQQISRKAADTVSGRMCDLLANSIAPQAIIDVGMPAIKGCGMSERKAEYIMGIAEAALSGEVDFGALHTLPDEEIVKMLTSLKGVGVWTAEMLLIFSLGRPNVVSYGDLAIRRGMISLYGLEDLSREQFARYAKRYSPYGSVASLYLWALAGQ